MKVEFVPPAPAEVYVTVTMPLAQAKALHNLLYRVGTRTGATQDYGIMAVHAMNKFVEACIEAKIQCHGG